MSESTKLYNTVQVQKLEAELNSETFTHIISPLTSDLSGETTRFSLVLSYYNNVRQIMTKTLISLSEIHISELLLIKVIFSQD